MFIQFLRRWISKGILGRFAICLFAKCRFAKVDLPYEPVRHMSSARMRVWRMVNRLIWRTGLCMANRLWRKGIWRNVVFPQKDIQPQNRNDFIGIWLLLNLKNAHYLQVLRNFLTSQITFNILKDQNHS